MSKDTLLRLVGLDRLSRRGSARGALPSGVAKGVEHRLVLSRRACLCRRCMFAEMCVARASGWGGPSPFAI